MFVLHMIQDRWDFESKQVPIAGGRGRRAAILGAFTSLQCFLQQAVAVNTASNEKLPQISTASTGAAPHGFCL